MQDRTYVMGIDYGTLSARAVILDCADGSIIASHTIPYPHGVITEKLPAGAPLTPEWALANAEDYDDALIGVIKGALEKAPIDPSQVVGVGVDATSYTMVPTDKEGRVLSTYPEFKNRPHAYIKLWKDHAAQEQSYRLRDVAKEAGEAFLPRCGGAPSCEWTLPKMMKMREEDKEVYDRAHYIFDLCDYLTWKLTGSIGRSLNSAQFKSHYAEWGYPSREFLDKLYPGFGDECYQKLAGPVINQACVVGSITPEMSRLTGLSTKTIVSTGAIDGHTSLVAVGLNQPGDATLVVGTSNVLAVLTDNLTDIPGVLGVGFGGYGPQLYGVDTGQSCTGDMLNWYVSNALPESYAQEARAQGVSPHTLLSNKAEAGEPWNNPLTIMDWWGGNRNVLCNLGLTGSIVGLNMLTKPEEIYCAMLQSIACGTRHIIERCAQYGSPVKHLVACGGIPCKNPFFMQQYANILGIPVHATTVSEGPAVGSAIYAAAAAKVYPSLEEAEAHMQLKERVVYYPDAQHAKEYEALYQRNLKYHNLLGITAMEN